MTESKLIIYEENGFSGLVKLFLKKTCVQTIQSKSFLIMTVHCIKKMDFQTKPFLYYIMFYQIHMLFKFLEIFYVLL